MIEGKNGVLHRISEQKEERENVKNQISKLVLQYQEIQEAEAYFQQKKSQFEQIIASRRERADRIAECMHPPYFAEEFSNQLREKLYGNDYEAALENIEEFGKEIETEKIKLSEEIQKKKETEKKLDQEISTLEKLLI